MSQADSQALSEIDHVSSKSPDEAVFDSASDSSLTETCDDLRIAALLDEFETRNRGGENVSLDTFLARNQEVAAPLRECLEGLQLLHAAATPCTSTPVLLPPGTRLGDFELEQHLGGGAMGVVYQAHQVSLSRPVALKVLSPSSALGKSRIERFRREVMAASSLDHPNIVPVHQVGEDLGLHYYAMRKIDGQSLDRPPMRDAWRGLRGGDVSAYATLAARFAEVADALHMAHQQGIVHRDVKPSNLIADRAGRIWVADFGLARHATIDDLTQSGEIVGTLRYMSPEQALGRSDAVDGRTDVYGIGATLYELLCGQPPFDGFEGIDLLRQIQHAEPTPLDRLRPKLPRDFVTIVQRAMRPEKSDRYGSSAELAADLWRFSSGQSIAARPVSLAERGLHWTRRNLAIVLGALALTLIGFVATLVHNQQLRYEQNRTQRAAMAADRNYAEARRAVDQLGSRLAERLLEIPGTETLRREVLADTLGYYERFVASSAKDPQLRLDVAKTRLEIARLHGLLGDHASARQQYAAAASELRDSNDREAQLVWAQAVNELATLLSEQGEQIAALQQLEQITLPDFSRTTKLPAGGDELLSDALTLNNLAIVNARLRRTDDAVAYLRQAIRLLSVQNQRGSANSAGGAPRLQTRLSDAMSNLSTIMSDLRRVDEALSLAQQAVRLRSELPVEDAAAMQHRAIAHSNLAAILMRADKVGDAIDAFRVATDMFVQIQQSRPQDSLVASRLGVTLNNLAMAVYAEGDADKAESLFHEARVHIDFALQKQPDHATNHATAAGIMNNLGVLLRDSNRSAESRRAFEAAIHFQQTVADLSPGKPEDSYQLSRIQNNLESLEFVQ